MPHKVLKSAYVHRVVKVRFATYLIVATVMLWILVYKMVSQRVPIQVALIGVLFGIVIGIIFSRMYTMKWDHGAEKVMLSMDVLGVLFFILFIAFDIFHLRIVGWFVIGRIVHIASFSVAMGVAYGCIIGLRDNIRKVLKKQNVLHL